MVIQQEGGCNSQLKGRGHRKEKGNGDNHGEGEWRKENLQGYREVHSECDGLSTEDDRREGGKKQGIKYINTTSHIAHLERVVTGSYIRRTAYRKDGWNLYIRDKKITFYGCKLGMTKKQVAAKLKNAKWNKSKTDKWDDGTTWIYYKPTNKTSYAYKTKGTLEIWFDAIGKVFRIEYHIG